MANKISPSIEQCCFHVVLISLVAGVVGCVAPDPDPGPDPLGLRDSPVVYDPGIGLNVATVDLVAGKKLDIGQVNVWLDGDLLHIRYSTVSDWLIEQTHVGLGEDFDALPLNPAGCPKVGQLPYGGDLLDPVDQVDVIVDLAAAGLDDAEELVIAAHAEVRSELLGAEGSWAGSDSFPGCKSIAKQFSVNLRDLRGLILWNKLGSSVEVHNSEIGPDGVIIGDISYFPTQHGDGFRPDPRLGDHNIPNNYVVFEGLELGQKGAIEFWYAPDWSNSAVGHVVDILYYGVAEDVLNNHIIMAFNDWQNRLGNVAIDSGAAANVAVQEFAPIPGWSTTQPIHVAFTWDGSASVVTDRLMVFIDGVALPNTFFSGDPQLDDWLANAQLRLGSRLVSGDWNRHNWEGLDGEMDNIKIWNFPKTDFSDRFVE